MLLWLLLYSISNRVTLYHATLEYEVSPKLSDNGQTQELPDSMNYPWAVWCKVITPLFRERAKGKKNNRARHFGWNSGIVRFSDLLRQRPVGSVPLSPSAGFPEHTSLWMGKHCVHQGLSRWIELLLTKKRKSVTGGNDHLIHTTRLHAVPQVPSNLIHWACPALIEKMWLTD